MSVAGRCASPIVTAAAALLAALAPNAAAAQDVLKLQQRPELRDVPALTRAYNGSGQALFKEFAARPGNIVFSPYSIGTAMAMALAGARGETEREMIAVLQHSLASGLVDDANARAIAVLNGYDRGDKPSCPATMQLAGDRCEGKPTAKNLPVHSEPERRHLRGEPALSSIGQAPGRQCVDDRRRSCGQGLFGPAQGQLRGGGVPGREPRHRQRLGQQAHRRQDRANPREDVRRGADQRGLFQIALGARLRQEADRAGVLQPDAQPPGAGSDHGAADQPRRGVARGLSRDPAALRGALAGDGDRAAERGGRAWRRRAPARPRRACANAGGAPQGAAAAGGSHAAPLQDGI